MGRRHFHFNPTTRDHLSEGACRVTSGPQPDIWPPHTVRRHVPPPPDAVLCEEPPSPTKRRFVDSFHSRESMQTDPDPQPPARRMYPRREEASPLGATKDCTATSLRRPCPDGAIQAPHKNRSSRRHFGDEFNLAQEIQQIQTSSLSNKRHVQSRTPSHLGSGGPQVVYTEYSASSRRHCPEMGGRPASVGAARRGILPHQRRHLAPEDHLIGSYVQNQDVTPRLCGNSKARASSNPPGSANMASVLVTEGSAWAPPDARRWEPSRRVLESEGHLLGGFLMPSDAPFVAEPFFSRRQYDEPQPNMIGGSMRSQAPSVCEVSHSRDCPEDNLIGGLFRPTSAPARVGGRRSSSVPATPSRRSEVRPPWVS